jgi:diadenosine tetraphosphatase ApaH/serine/threonine PP2A family protein phosphatase
VLRDAAEQGCTHHAFLGDFVGYGADPKPCLDIVRGMKAPCVKGNHDDYCATDFPLDDFNPKAARMVEWTRRQLTEEDRRWLRALDYVRTVEDFTIVHATPEAPEKWEYVFDKSGAASSLSCQATQVCFFEHTHVPVAFIHDPSGLGHITFRTPTHIDVDARSAPSHVRGGTYSKFKIETGKKYFVNAGSVGQPRDNNPKSAYAVYDIEKGTIELRRCAYDVEETRRKIREAGLNWR